MKWKSPKRKLRVSLNLVRAHIFLTAYQKICHITKINLEFWTFQDTQLGGALGFVGILHHTMENSYQHHRFHPLLTPYKIYSIPSKNKNNSNLLRKIEQKDTAKRSSPKLFPSFKQRDNLSINIPYLKQVEISDSFVSSIWYPIETMIYTFPLVIQIVTNR